MTDALDQYPDFARDELELVASIVGVSLEELIRTDGRENAFETYRSQLKELRSNSPDIDEAEKAKKKKSKKKSKKRAKQNAEVILDAAQRDIEPVGTIRMDRQLSLRHQNAYARRAEALAASDEAANENYEQEIKLRKRLALWSIIAASAMLAIGSVIFWRYMTLVSVRETVPAEAIIAWLSSSVLEVLGIVYLIASYLFPKPKGD